MKVTEWFPYNEEYSHPRRNGIYECLVFDNRWASYRIRRLKWNYFYFRHPETITKNTGFIVAWRGLTKESYDKARKK